MNAHSSTSRRRDSAPHPKPAPLALAHGRARNVAVPKAPRPRAGSGELSRYLDELRGMGRDWTALWRDALVPRSIPTDLLAGLTVAAVALPLNVALAVASGLPPIAGLISGALGGMTAAIFGGAALQVTGPAAALQVMVLAVARDFGVEGAAAAALVIGIVEIVLALTLAGKLARLVPEAVLAGFTTGVGIKLLDSQVPELLGFGPLVDHKLIDIVLMMHRPAWLHHVALSAVVSGLVVAFFVTTLRHLKRFPAALVGIVIATAVANYLHWDIERVGSLPSTVPPPAFPGLPDERWLDLAARTLPLALLAGVESLLSAKSLDRMGTGVRAHNPNLELFGQGLANLVVGFFRGMPVTGVIVRSGVNAQSGARSKLSALTHGAALLVVVLYLGEQIARVPLAALAGLLCVIAVRLVEVGTFVHLARTARIEALAFAVTMIGTLSGHLMWGLLGGLVVYAIGAKLFHKRRPDATNRTREQAERGIRAVLARDHAAARHPGHFEELPRGHGWLANIRERAHVATSAFVHHQATLIGRVVLGDHVHIAAGSSVRADEGSPFFIGANSNIQDGVVIHALKERRVIVGGEEWAVYVGKNVSIAHNALVHGPCYIGDDSFVGFKAVVHDSVVGARCFVGIGAVVVGVEVPEGRFVPHGAIVDSADAVDRLPRVSETQMEFNEDVVGVNRGLAVAYREHVRRGDAGAFRAAERAAAPPAVWESGWDADSSRDRF